LPVERAGLTINRAIEPGHVDTSKQIGDVDHFKVFASEEAAEKWFAENDPEGVAFEYPVIGADEK
jgi:hypothetical protein